MQKKNTPSMGAALDIAAVATGRITVRVLGDSPLLFNSMSAKAQRELLMPKGRKTSADKAASLKHNPYTEFVASMYRDPRPDALTRLMLPAPAFKGAMATAALDMPGAKKSEIGRLTWVAGESVAIYGIPRLRMDVVRSADMNRTPDVRTRACCAQWAAEITVHYVRPKLNETAVATLLNAAGTLCGVGDFRQEKGRGNNGQFHIVSPDDPDFARLVASAGREEQDAAIESPEPWDNNTAELMGWFNAEVGKRGKDTV